MSINKIYNILRRGNMKIRRDIIWLMGLQARNIRFLDSPISKPREDVKRLGIYAKAEDFIVPHLIHKEETVTYSFQRRYIYEIPNAIIDPTTGMVYDQEGNYIPESMAWETTRLLSEIPRPRIKKIKKILSGEYIFLPSTPTYYHWLIQDLPVFIGAYEKNPKAKILIGPHNFKPLQAFIKQYFCNNFKTYINPIRVEKLIMVAKDCGMGIPYPPLGSPNPEDIRRLQKYFCKYREEKKEQKLMIYLSRSRWKRAMKSEELLEKVLKEMGFVIFHGDIGFFEQIKLFSKAKVIIGATGAAMSNMIWAMPKTKIIQLHLPKDYWHFYYNLGHICKHDYNFVEVPDAEWLETDINNIIEKIKEVI